MTTDIRKQVEAEIIRTMAEAEKAGRCPMDAARATFSGTPGMVLGGCYAEMQMAEEEAWWEAVERIIDGELIRNAVAAARA